jgi:hypothetical protein
MELKLIIILEYSFDTFIFFNLTILIEDMTIKGSRSQKKKKRTCLLRRFKNGIHKRRLFKL